MYESESSSEMCSFPPRGGTIRDACNRYGIGRSTLYKEAAKRPGLFRKWGGRTIVDYALMDEVFSNLPPAEIKLPHSAKARRG